MAQQYIVRYPQKKQPGNSPFVTYLWVPTTSTEIRIELLVIYDHWKGYIYWIIYL